MDFFAVSPFLSLAFNPLDPLNTIFGWMTRVFYEFFGSYGIAIIVLTIVIRGILIPLNVRSQKSMIKQQALGSQQAEIKRKYPNDKQKQQEEMTKLMSQNGVSSLGGCVLPFVQMLFLFPLFYVVRGPLRYITQVSTYNLTKLGDFLGPIANGGKGVLNAGEVSQVLSNNIPIIREFQKNPQLIQEAVGTAGKGIFKLGQMIDMNFMGLNLALTPSYNPSVILGAERAQYLPLLIIPVLVLLTTLLQMRITNILKPNYKADKDAKERAKLNPARKDQVPENSMENTMKMMFWLMPVIMLVTTFTFPSAMGFYWLVGNIMQIIQLVIVYLLFTKPLEEKKAEMAILKAHAFSKAAQVTEVESEVTINGKSGSSKRYSKSSAKYGKKSK